MDKNKKPKKPPEPVHQPGTRAGERMKSEEGKESGRYETGANAAGRTSGKADLKKDRSVGSQEPIDPNSPHIQTP
ncbi:MAG TPA: hypothetical protein VGM01_12290 [Ktedonobacteraceae bacterium]